MQYMSLAPCGNLRCLYTECHVECHVDAGCRVNMSTLGVTSTRSHIMLLYTGCHVDAASTGCHIFAASGSAPPGSHSAGVYILPKSSTACS